MRLAGTLTEDEPLDGRAPAESLGPVADAAGAVGGAIPPELDDPLECEPESHTELTNVDAAAMAAIATFVLV